MMEWRVNEINLWNFPLNLNESLCLPVFEKRIHPKYLQYSRMVLSILCNDDKIWGNKLPELFWYKCIRKLYCLSQIFWAKELAGILEKLSSFSASYQLFLILLHGHIVFCEDQKTNLKSTIGQDCLSHLAILCIERAYVNRLDLEKVIDEFSSKKGRSKFFFQLIFRQKNIGDLNIIKKVNWWILCLSKEILTLPINKKLELNLSFVPIINRCLSSLQMTFKCFFLVNP